MPFFSRSVEPEEEIIPTHQEQPEMKRGRLFGSLRRDPSPAPSAATANTYNTTGRHSTVSHNSDLNSVNDSVRTPGSHRSFLHRSFGHGNGSGSDTDLDPSIIAARERVMSAETAEREADRALDIARREVREARDHVKRLELEAKEEARKAKIKQFHAREVSRRAKPLGRHDI
ncbi:hypothetical protein SCUCBS95973_007316 [Sporothrix curviconia]|uniref:Uncharacterized protein n=1 Tax=Sporothrix curviconia TaxID=1260050 RepID=A0ABP0CF36_9PEZI